jgi:phosphate transport system substrate-binding protein
MKTPRFCRAIPLLGIFFAISAHAQAAESLSHVAKVYIGSFGDGRGADAMRVRITNRLRANSKPQLVPSPQEADAILSGTGHIWITGYTSLGVHPSPANRQPVYDGFLSVEVKGKAGAILWSYLVTPSRFPLNGIANDLADQLEKKFLEALMQGSPEAPAAGVNQSTAQVSIHGAGATFPWPIYQKWFESFQEKSPNVSVRYDPVGSELGVQALVKGKVDFAASDMPLSDETMLQSQVKLLHFASVLGAVVPIYNLANVHSSLNFTPEALAGIYLGKIKRWNDPIIKASNHGVSLPDSEIVVVHRSDGSGTSFVWSDYLSKISPEWKHRVGPGSTLSWPVGQGAERNEGVADVVHQTPNSVGYVELIYAIQNELSSGAVRNAAGNFVRADLASVTAAASNADAANSDLRLSITNAPGKQSYPIATFTWLLLPAEPTSTQERSAMLEFLRWMLTSGQKQCAGLGYAPLPSSIVDREMQILSRLK